MPGFSRVFFDAFFFHRRASYPAEVMFHMSPKELMYIEDALNHEQFLQSQFQQAAQALQNPQLKNCVSQMAKNHNQLFQKLDQLV